MAIASAAVRTSNVTTNQALVEVIASSTAAYKIMEIGISLVTATATVVGMGKPAAIGVIPTAPAAFVFEDYGNTSTPASTTALAWGTSPTMPTVQQRRLSFAATIGVGAIVTFPRGFAVLKALTFTCNNILGGATTDIWIVIDE